MDDETRQRFREQDSYLQVLISLAEDGTKIPVTLSIGGMLVTGNLISTQEYREGFEKLLQRRVLFTCGDAGIADFHAHIFVPIFRTLKRFPFLEKSSESNV